MVQRFDRYSDNIKLELQATSNVGKTRNQEKHKKMEQQYLAKRVTNQGKPKAIGNSRSQE